MHLTQYHRVASSKRCISIRAYMLSSINAENILLCQFLAWIHAHIRLCHSYIAS